MRERNVRIVYKYNLIDNRSKVEVQKRKKSIKTKCVFPSFTRVSQFLKQQNNQENLKLYCCLAMVNVSSACMEPELELNKDITALKKQ